MRRMVIALGLITAPLGDQDRARPAQAGQLLGLPTGLVLGLSEQGPPPLPQRRLSHRAPGLGQHLPVLTGPQASLQQRLLGVEMRLVQPAGLDPPRSPVLHIDQRPTAPQRQRLTEQVCSRPVSSRSPWHPTPGVAASRSRLAEGAEEVDARRFERLVERGHELLGWVSRTRQHRAGSATSRPHRS
jgi:hypothetical protein